MRPWGVESTCIQQVNKGKDWAVGRTLGGGNKKKKGGNPRGATTRKTYKRVAEENMEPLKCVYPRNTKGKG